jgi:uncharacterized membrane protein YkoI
MRLGSKWIAAPAAGLVLLVGGIGVASAMSNDNRTARVTTTAPIQSDDRGTASGQDSASDRNDDRGTLSGRDGDGTSDTVAQRARAAALAAVPGASVREVEHATSTPGAVYRVELVKGDGTRVEVDLNANFVPVKIEQSGHDS